MMYLLILIASSIYIAISTYLPYGNAIASTLLGLVIFTGWMRSTAK
jgi:hypothetical protein